jgi:hypothetical protein
MRTVHLKLKRYDGWNLHQSYSRFQWPSVKHLPDVNFSEVSLTSSHAKRQAFKAVRVKWCVCVSVRVCLCVCVSSYFIANLLKIFSDGLSARGTAFSEPSIFGLCRLDAPFCPCYFADRKLNQDGRASFNVMSIITTLGGLSATPSCVKLSRCKLGAKIAASFTTLQNPL